MRLSQACIALMLSLGVAGSATAQDPQQQQQEGDPISVRGTLELDGDGGALIRVDRNTAYQVTGGMEPPLMNLVGRTVSVEGEIASGPMVEPDAGRHPALAGGNPRSERRYAGPDRRHHGRSQPPCRGRVARR